MLYYEQITELGYQPYAVTTFATLTTSLSFSCLVDGLPLNEVRTVTEKSSCPSDLRDEKNREIWLLSNSQEICKIICKTDDEKLEQFKNFFFESLTIFLRRVEFSTPAYNLLNALEKIGYRYLFMFYNRSSSRAKFAEFEYQEIILTSSVLSGQSQVHPLYPDNKSSQQRILSGRSIGALTRRTWDRRHLIPADGSLPPNNGGVHKLSCLHFHLLQIVS